MTTTEKPTFHDFDVIVGLLPYLTDAGFEKLSAIAVARVFCSTTILRSPRSLTACISFTERRRATPSTEYSQRLS